MQVVLFCGGRGVRMHDYTRISTGVADDTALPKPLVRIGNRPIIWHIMKYYASFGHTDFILALGYQQDLFKEYFINYTEWLSNDIEIQPGGELKVFQRDIDDWSIRLIDTGLDSNIGTRLWKLKSHISDDMFLANYTDGLTDMNLDHYIASFDDSKYVGSIMTVHPSLQFHNVIDDGDGTVSAIDPPQQMKGLSINTGYFLFRKEIFDYINEGEELVEEPMNRLAEKKLLRSYNYAGFWRNIDNIKDKQYIEDLYHSNKAPWVTW